MELNFTDYSLVGLNCQYFTGVRQHGQKLTLDLDRDSCDIFEVYCEGKASIHIHQDGTIYVTTMDYNYSTEEWEETIVKDLTNDNEVKEALDKWLKNNPLYRSHQFPYPVSTRRDFWGSDQICDSLDSLISYLKTY